MVCKYALFGDIPWSGVGFILTKWYVNFNELIGIVKDISSFILTKWYVNFNELISQIKDISKFYIN